MAAFYLDTSALVKRYAVERGTPWVVQLCDPATGHDLFTARLTGAEMTSALYRKLRAGELQATAAADAEAEFPADWVGSFQLVEVTAALVATAMALARRHPLRAYDAIHCAASLSVAAHVRSAGLGSVTMVSADHALLAAAAAEGLLCEDPNTHG